MNTVEELAANLATPSVATPEEKAKEHKHTAGRAAFHLTNFLGLHFIFNSGLSLWLTYNLLPTKPAQAAMEGMAKFFTPINAGIDSVTTPIKKAWTHFASGGKTVWKAVSAEQKAIDMAHSSRSRVETAFMCIAGCIALFPVKYLEDHSAGFINAADDLFHPNRSKEEKESSHLRQEEQPKESWGNLIRARVIGLSAVFAADGVQQNINNKRMAQGKGTFDTAVWQWGANTYETMKESTRSRLIEFFSRKQINLSSIQPMMRSSLLDTIGSPPELRKVSDEILVLQKQMRATSDKAHIKGLEADVAKIEQAFHAAHPHLKPDVERAIFAEQSRLLITKELWLTLLCAGFIYTAAKAPFMANFFEKMGMGKKDAAKPEPHTAPALQSVTSTVEVREKEQDGEITTQKQTVRIMPRERPQKPPELYTQQLAREQEAAAVSPIL